jgi:hypothetical protein
VEHLLHQEWLSFRWADPKLAHWKGAEHSRETGYVIRIRVGCHNHRKVPNVRIDTPERRKGCTLGRACIKKDMETKRRGGDRE